MHNIRSGTILSAVISHLVSSGTPAWDRQIRYSLNLHTGGVLEPALPARQPKWQMSCAEYWCKVSSGTILVGALYIHLTRTRNAESGVAVTEREERWAYDRKQDVPRIPVFTHTINLLIAALESLVVFLILGFNLVFWLLCLSLRDSLAFCSFRRWLTRDKRGDWLVSQLLHVPRKWR